MRAFHLILLTLIVPAMGCSDSSTRPAVDSGASLDGRVDDASTSLDAAAIDGAAASDSGTTIDAGGSDAATAVDGSSGDGGGGGAGPSPTAVCEVVCAAIEACIISAGGGPDLGCVEECSVDLADCSGAQRTTLLSCGDDGCVIGASGTPAIIECISRVSCVDMGGGPTPTPMPRP